MISPVAKILFALLLGGLVVIAATLRVKGDAVKVLNNSEATVELVACEDFKKIPPGASVTVRGPRIACSIFNTIPIYVGCLRFTEEDFITGAVSVTSMDVRIPQHDCGKGDEYFKQT